MKSPILSIISFLFFAVCSCSGRLLENNLFIASDNPSAFNLNLNSIIQDGSRLQKDGLLHPDQEISPWSSSSEKSATKDENRLSFSLSPTGIQIKNKADELSASNKAESVSHLLQTGKETAPSRPSRKLDSMVAERRLSKSTRSPGVGHMQVTRPKLHTINGNIIKSHHSNGDDTGNKRKLRSTRSPGAGH